MHSCQGSFLQTACISLSLMFTCLGNLSAQYSCSMACSYRLKVAKCTIAGFFSILQFYSDGVYNEYSCSMNSSSLSHEMLVVGYGVNTYNLPYWIVKNRYMYEDMPMTVLYSWKV